MLIDREAKQMASQVCWQRQKKFEHQKEKGKLSLEQQGIFMVAGCKLGMYSKVEVVVKGRTLDWSGAPICCFV
jgi:hypothetical protein